MRKLFRKRSVVLGLVASLVIAAAAFAYWTTSGSGTGSAATGTNTAVTITQVGSISGLVPGGNAQAIDFKINNPATTKQYVSTVAVSIASIKDSHGDDATGCSAADFDLVQPTAINDDLTNGDHTFSPSGATIAMKDLSSNQDGCKNVTVNLAFNAS